VSELPGSIEITEVGPRDGLQNQEDVISTAAKITFVESLASSGLKRIEATAFVSPRWIPQLADADEVMACVKRRPDVEYSAVVPNMMGWDRAHAAKMDCVAVLASASETFSLRNTNADIETSFARIEPVISAAVAAGVKVRGYVSCAIKCPYEGDVPVAAVRKVAGRLLSLGVDELSLADTIGAAEPSDIGPFLEAMGDLIAPADVILHLHDTRGTALACVMEAMKFGARRFDAAAGGLGGCPYAPGAPGNLATEHLVALAQREGISTGVDLDLLAAATSLIKGGV